MRKASPVLAVAFAMGVAVAADGRSAPEQEIFNCRQNWEPSATICNTPSLQKQLASVERHYAQMKNHPDPEIRYLSSWDRYYFGVNVWNCRNPPHTPSDISQCVHSIIENKRSVLDAAVSRDTLLSEIASSGSFDAGLVQRYPTFFIGRVGSFCGWLKVRVVRQKLAGTFEDCQTHKLLPLEFETTTQSDRLFFASRPEVVSWFRGRFENRSGAIVFVAAPWSVEPSSSK